MRPELLKYILIIFFYFIFFIKKKNRYNMLYTIEEIVTGKKVSFPQMKIDDLRNNFTDLVYENEKKIY